MTFKKIFYKYLNAKSLNTYFKDRICITRRELNICAANKRLKSNQNIYTLKRLIVYTSLYPIRAGGRGVL